MFNMLCTTLGCSRPRPTISSTAAMHRTCTAAILEMRSCSAFLLICKIFTNICFVKTLLLLL